MLIKKNILSLFLIALILSSCAGANYRPIVDNKGVDLNKYEADLKECQAYAQQAMGAGEGAAIGGAAGAGLGAILGAIAGASKMRSAGIGGVTGVVAGGAHGEKGQHEVINRCLIGRGYKVLQ